MNKNTQRIKSPHQKFKLVTLMGWLLLIQAGVLAAMSVYHFMVLQFGSELINQWWSNGLSNSAIIHTFIELLRDLFTRANTEKELSTLVESLLLLGFALLALITAFRFFYHKKTAWFWAMLIQAATLSLAIIIYFIKKPAHTYFLMAYCIFMVVYLQHADIYKSFREQAVLQGVDQTDEIG
jgi:hypothetical protein